MTDFVEMNGLEQLKSMTVVVADTGEFQAISKFSPQGNVLACFLLFNLTPLANSFRCDYQSISYIQGRKS